MICERCLKTISPYDGNGIHTCTPTDGWGKLESEIATIKQKLFKAETERGVMIESYDECKRNLDALKQRMEEVEPVAWDEILGWVTTPKEQRPKLYLHPAPAPAKEGIPDILFDGNSVFQQIKLAYPARMRTSPENVSDVLDAVVTILRNK